MKTLEDRLEALEKIVGPYIERAEDIARTEHKILGMIRQMARIKAARYYIDDQGRRCHCSPSDIDDWKLLLDIEISKLGVDLMGTDVP